MHNFNIIRKSIDFCGRTLTLETGKIAKQANGSVLVTYGETIVLVTAVIGDLPKEETDFFPLTVDYMEKMFASGKVPGGFFKREAKPTTDATLNARLIDRTIRPLFPEGFRNPVHVVVTVLSYDEVNDPAYMGMIGASAALGISDIPFNGPIAGATVGYLDDKFVVNPSLQDMKDSMLNLSVGGSKTSIVMIEGAASEMSEEQMLEAVYLGHEEIKKVCILQDEFTAEAGKPKIEIKLDVIPEDIIRKIENDFEQKIKDAANILGKQARNDAFDQLKEQFIGKYTEELGIDGYNETKHHYMAGYEELIRKCVREAILFNNHRVDGRTMDEIRPITCEIDILPRVHGSALFTRGETQALGTVTLGGGDDAQIIDGLAEEYKKHFYLQYNFPPYSVGEVGRMGAPGRRELGHGNLAERGLQAVIPSMEDFPYSMRIVSDIMESNGSSSMASVCAGTLALMAAGVPIKAPVAGIANGLIMEGDKFVVLTDIMGLEDHLGDMDFKVTGTRKGITAMQMDIKIQGITKEIMSIALTKALAARNHILDIIHETIPESRADLSSYAPRVISFKVPTDRIGEIIGPSGKMIKSIIEATKCSINIDDTGTVTLLSPDKASIDAAQGMIMNIITDLEVGQIYEGVVSRIEPFGAFVKVMGTKEGLVHISQMHTARLAAPEDMVHLGDKVKVRYIGSEKGKISLSMKDVPGNPEPDPSKLQERTPRPEGDDRRRNDRDHGRHDDRRPYNRGGNDRNRRY
ncbi:MAG TPA: polyribonucleotide nucleotidyltransferase [Candidatus Cloacimonadota bacterium]|nr:polyribonucleotide nucleotidyltransferase [Candidatus Cloacimonadota bacterium]HPT72633.1 polyribonucleotide nucleotidyltransferase [Candidatus Cloacimonadota bacterium]